MSEKSFSDKLESFGNLGAPSSSEIPIEQSPPITEHERECAQVSLQNFVKGKYQECHVTLHCLKESRAKEKDVKLDLNCAVVNFYVQGKKDFESFEKTLTQILYRIKDDESDAALYVIYNYAFVLFRTGQLPAALKQLTKAFNSIETMDEGLAQRVCLLMLEVLISLGQPQKALSLLSYVENHLLTSLTQSLSISDKGGHKHKKDTPPKNPSDNTVTATLPPPFQLDWFNIKLSTIKARCKLLLRSRGREEDVKALYSLDKPDFKTSSLMLVGHVEYLKNQFNTSARVLNSISPSEDLEKGDSPKILWLNNSAVAHYSSGRSRLAIRFLTRAIELTNSPPISRSDAHMRLIEAQLSLNLGVILLQTNQPELAFQYLLKAAKFYPSNPRLWLRLAECCICVRQSTNSFVYDLDGHGKDVLKGIIACAAGRKLILSSNLSKIYSSDKYNSNATLSLEFASLCLKNALILINKSDNETYGGKYSTDLHDGSQASDISIILETINASPKQPQCLPSSPLTESEIESLKISILTSSAFVNLCLGEPLLAVENAKALLAIPSLPSAYKFLGQLYAAEGLIQLDQISEAIELLQPQILSGAELSFATATPSNNEELEPGAEIRPQAPWEPMSVQTAQGTLLYNLAVAFAIRGNLDKASQVISQIWGSKTENSKIPIHLIMLSVYVELQQGHVQNARNLVIKHGIPLQPGWGTA